jgi:putative transposase
VLILRIEFGKLTKETATMAGITSVDLARRVGESLEQASPDLLRAMVQTFAEALMGAEADVICGAPYGRVSEDRVNYRNGYRQRRWDTRAETIELAVPEVCLTL